MNGKDDTKNLPIYLKTNEVGITISKLYFWISLSEMIQWKQTLKYASNKAFRENRFLIKLVGWFNWWNEMYCGLKRFHWLAEPKTFEG